VGVFCRIPLYGRPRGRRCRRCRELLPFSAFRPNLKLSSGWSSWCRACSAEATRAWRERNRERINAARRTSPAKLTCVECGEVFEGRKGRLLCGRRSCKDKRYARLHPDKVREKQARKYQRRKAA
jgi:hypothetical protein